MNLLVLGSSGYIGSNILNGLKANHDVYTLYRNKQLEGYDLFEFFNSEEKLVFSGSLEELLNAPLNLTLDGVVNAAGSINKLDDLSGIEENISANIIFTSLTSLLAIKLKVKFYIFLTTYSSNVQAKAYTPQTFYAATKKSAENLLEYFSYSHYFRTYILEIFDVYGPNQPHLKFFNQLLDAVLQKKPFEMTPGNQEINFIYIDDLVNAVQNLVDREERGVLDSTKSYNYSVYGNEVFQLKNVPRIVQEILVYGDKLDVRISKEYRRNEIMVFNPRFKRIPNWLPSTSLRQGIKKILESQTLNGTTNA
jgi:nucleoside-diphosphate-sugar epimerase